MSWGLWSPTPGVLTAQTDTFGYVRLSRQGIMEDFAQDLPKSGTSVMAATEGQINGKEESGKKATHAAWEKKPMLYIVADNDRMIPPGLEVKMAARMHAKTIHIASRHVIMLSHPAEVATFMEQATR